MARTIVFFLLLVSVLHFGRACAARTRYKDFIVVGRNIWVLTAKGRIRLIDTVSWTTVRQNDARHHILLLTKDRDENPVVVDKTGHIKRYNIANGSWATMAEKVAGVYALLFDSRNDGYAVTDSGIRPLKSGDVYFSNKSLNHQIRYQATWSMPACSFMDRNDNVWLGFGYGEWGGNLFVFNIRSREFLKPKLDSFSIGLWPIKSFFEDDSGVYLSAGLQHFTSSGAIVRMDALKASIILHSEPYSGRALKWDSLRCDSVRQWVAAEYIGPGAYNAFNNSIYFYSQHGIFRGRRGSDLSKIQYWAKLTTPKLHWTDGQPDAVGSPMNVQKLTILDEHRFLLLAQNDGIGYFDGNTLKLIK
jgi:hypothetical protein